jgi:predicted phosphodiesterase
MRIALLSDIHANWEAAEAVLRDISRRGADHIVCLGDIVGYNADPAACIDLLAEAGALCIAGNHDLAVVGRISTDGFSVTAARAVSWTRRHLSSCYLGWLAGLPLEAHIDGVVVVHGALLPSGGCPITRLDDEMRRADCFAALAAHPTSARICAFGHTHQMGIFEALHSPPRALAGDETCLLPDALYLVNPGTVGQSRTRERRATYALLDTGRRHLTMHRVEYDEASALARTRAAGLAKRDSRLPSSLRSALWSGLGAVGLQGWMRSARDAGIRREIMSHSTIPHVTSTPPEGPAGPPR